MTRLSVEDVLAFEGGWGAAGRESVCRCTIPADGALARGWFWTGAGGRASTVGLDEPAVDDAEGGGRGSADCSASPMGDLEESFAFAEAPRPEEARMCGGNADAVVGGTGGGGGFIVVLCADGATVATGGGAV